MAPVSPEAPHLNAVDGFLVGDGVHCYANHPGCKESRCLKVQCNFPLWYSVSKPGS